MEKVWFWNWCLFSLSNGPTPPTSTKEIEVAEQSQIRAKFIFLSPKACFEHLPKYLPIKSATTECSKLNFCEIVATTFHLFLRQKSTKSFHFQGFSKHWYLVAIDQGRQTKYTLITGSTGFRIFCEKLQFHRNCQLLPWRKSIFANKFGGRDSAEFSLPGGKSRNKSKKWADFGGAKNKVPIFSTLCISLKYLLSLQGVSC